MNGCRLHEIWLSGKPSYQWAIWKLFCTHRLINKIDIGVDIVRLLCTNFTYRWENHVDAILPTNGKNLVLFVYLPNLESPSNPSIILANPILLNDVRARIDWRRQYKCFIYRLSYELRSEQYCLCHKKEITLTIQVVTKTIKFNVLRLCSKYSGTRTLHVLFPWLPVQLGRLRHLPWTIFILWTVLKKTMSQTDRN